MSNSIKFRQAIHSIEKLEEEKKSISEEIKNILSSLKDEGYEPKIIKALLKVRKMDKDKYERDTEELSLYMSLLGMSVRANEEEDDEE